MGILLAKMVEVTGSDGEHVIVDPMGPLLMSAVFLFLLLVPIIILMLFFFYKKKLQHQQILAAIDKGQPVSELLAAPAEKAKGWLSNISAGIGLIFVAVALLVLYIPAGVYISHNLPRNALVVIPIILLGMGITRLIRGICQRKEADKEKEQAPEEAEVDVTELSSS
jgi:hypothetical protein